METEIIINDLQQRLSSLTTESDEFIIKYLKRTLKNPVYTADSERIYLPYDGKDSEFICRLFKLYTQTYYPEYELTNEAGKVIKYLAEIATESAPKRGLIIRGTVGSGKTLLMLLWLQFRQRILNNQKPHPYYRDDFLKKEFYSFTPQTLVDKFKKTEYELFNRLSIDVLFIDDVGELTEINNFGTRINLISEVILNRYNRFKFNPSLEIYVTTNLTSKQLTEVIGERAFSRLMEMAEYNSGLLIGNDRRLSSNIVKQWPVVNWKSDIKLAN